MKHRLEGRLRLRFTAGSPQTTLHVEEQIPPLKVVRAFTLEDGGALVHLHNVSGGVLGGDKLEHYVEVQSAARAQLTTTSATRIYRSRQNSPPSLQINEIKVGGGGLLEMLPDTLIPYRGSAYHQQTQIDLADDAGLFWWETVAPGREARGELFDYDLLALDLRISAQGWPIAIERTRLEPHTRAMSSSARLGTFRYFSTFYICRVGLPEAEWSALESELNCIASELSRRDEIVWGVSTLVAHGLVVRALSRKGRDIPPGLLAFWKAAKQALYKQEAVPPRKIY
jgi:urease accessory protein